MHCILNPPEPPLSLPHEHLNPLVCLLEITRSVLRVAGFYSMIQRKVETVLRSPPVCQLYWPWGGGCQHSLNLSRPLQSWLGVSIHVLQLEKHVQRQDLESTSVLLQNWFSCLRVSKTSPGIGRSPFLAAESRRQPKAPLPTTISQQC